MEIRIGTSGYSFEDWRGVFYPGQIDKGKMLDYYQNYFDTVEINSTYYRIPHPAVLYNMAKKTKPEFEFIVKANQNLTHQRRQIEAPMVQFKEAIRPLVDRGQLKGILAQFPWSFKYSSANLAPVGNCSIRIRFMSNSATIAGCVRIPMKRWPTAISSMSRSMARVCVVSCHPN